MSGSIRVPRLFRALLLVFVGLVGLGATVGPVSAFPVGDPNRIQVPALVAIGDDGAAWLRIDGKDLLVSPGYMLTRDLRVTAVRPEGVTLYRPVARQYFSLPPLDGAEVGLRDPREALLRVSPLPLWKAIRMIALAYRKDYICHGATFTEIAVRRHAKHLDELLSICVNPHHRAHGREGTIYVGPSLIEGVSWSRYHDQVRTYRSKILTQWFPGLGKTATYISDGKRLDQVLAELSHKAGTPLITRGPIPIPVFCSFKGRPWHEILANVVLFNGLGIYPTTQGIHITGH